MSSFMGENSHIDIVHIKIHNVAYAGTYVPFFIHTITWPTTTRRCDNPEPTSPEEHFDFWFYTAITIIVVVVQVTPSVASKVKVRSGSHPV